MIFQKRVVKYIRPIIVCKIAFLGEINDKHNYVNHFRYREKCNVPQLIQHLTFLIRYPLYLVGNSKKMNNTES